MNSVQGHRALGGLALRERQKTKTGCGICRQRRKKCDEQHPQCGSCKRLKLNCFWPVISQSPLEDASRRSSSASSNASLELVRRSKQPGTYSLLTTFDHPSSLRASPTSFLSERDEKEAFQFINQRGGTILKVFKKHLPVANNIFTIGFVAVRNFPSLLNAHLAIGAAHLSKVHGSTFSAAASRYYRRAIRELVAELARTDIVQPSELACATASALSVYEVGRETLLHSLDSRKLIVLDEQLRRSQRSLDTFPWF